MKTYKYKLQGDGRDSWICTETDDLGNLIDEYMVYEDPYKAEQNTNRVVDFFANCTPQEIEQIKQILGINN